MRLRFSKSVITIIIILVVFGVGVPVIVSLRNESQKTPLLEPVEKPGDLVSKYKVIGLSVEGRKIEAYSYLPPVRAGGVQAGGNGEKHILFVGGMHGGYEWNSVLLAYKFMDYLVANPAVIPKNLTVTVIPSANPDGVFEVVGKEGRFMLADVSTNEKVLASGRFNAHDVDLNRNFACQWQPESMWRGMQVSAGTAAFSEPEARAIRDFVLADKPAAVIFWHSQANTVYASYCQDGILAGTLDIMNAYSRASGYKAATTFDAYEITGDAEGWLASINIPAITVELETHQSIEWERNLAGIKALFEYYGSVIK